MKASQAPATAMVTTIASRRGPGVVPGVADVAVVAVSRGFTLIELLIVIAIGAVLATIAVPSFRDMLNTTRQRSALGLIVNDLNQARGEAIKRNGNVLLCARATGTGTEPCGAATDWANGWVVCWEGSIAGQCGTATPASPNPFTVRPALDPTLTLTAGNVAANTAIGFIRFKADSTQLAGPGNMVGLVNMALGGTWSGATLRYVCVAGTGNISKQLVVCQ